MLHIEWRSAAHLRPRVYGAHPSMPLPDTGRMTPVTDPALKNEITNILMSGFYFLLFPRFIETFFRTTYHQTALNNLKANSIYILLTYALLGALVFIQLPYKELGAFPICYALGGVCLGLIALLSSIKAFNHLYHWYTGPIAMLGLVILLHVSTTVTNPEIKLAAYAGSIYAIITLYSMLKMRFFIVTFWCHFAGLIHLLGLSASGNTSSFISFQVYFVSANLIGMGIAYIIEHRERAIFLQGLLLDIDKIEKKKLYEDLEKLSREDSLTCLANRRYFDERLEQEWNRCRREKRPLSVVLLDVDFFKQYNDFYGHQAGDHCLMNLAKALKLEASRPGELVGRYGGEEFIILYPNIDEEQIRTNLQRILERVHDLNMEHRTSTVNTMVTISLGAATAYPVRSIPSERVVTVADKMLYKSKNNGRDRWYNTKLSHCEVQPSQLEILP